ncbi:Predicted dehydrogenase [Arthrobacter alpinus]|uniref:Predicted dehydrogenase n=1 Tax=Arthrobacter alpinus TaxID=656366 RepID=A0A1H5PJW5_9MICC|nr:Gfo/Idh/MocA family oxidoreductase [Arthrobacter alpinus]SEF13317.1 Predicted dehydrogenase [Arthrobacter alpinus]
MNTQRPIKIAIASFAHEHALSYASILSRMPGIEILTADPDGALATDGATRGSELAHQMGLNYVDDYSDLLAWQPDAVIVTSENSRHRELVERAAGAGAHILCEKPIATEIKDAEAMVAACRDAGAILMIAYPVRFSPAFASLKNHLAAGHLGEPISVSGTNNGKIPSTSRGWFTDQELAGGGALIDHIVHCADLIDSMTDGEQPLSVYAVANTILHADKNISVETGGLVTITYESGLIASIDCSWSLPDSAATWGSLTLQVVGTKGTIEIEPFTESISGIGADGPLHVTSSPNLDRLLLAEFISAVRHSGRAVFGSTPKISAQPDGGVGIRTLKIVAAARTSAKNHQPVLISQLNAPHPAV